LEAANHSFIISFIESNLIDSTKYILKPYLENIGTTTIEQELEKMEQNDI
jgi:hypothetical protein